MSVNKNLKYFMRKDEERIINAPAPDSFRDENGNVLQMQIKCLPQSVIDEINDSYKKKSIATDKKGNPIVSGGEVVWKVEKDADRAVRHIIAEALVFPNLKDEELMKFYNCFDISEMPKLVFSRPGEYAHVVKMVLVALGISDGDETTEGVKESDVEGDIDAAKN